MNIEHLRAIERSRLTVTLVLSGLVVGWGFDSHAAEEADSRRKAETTVATVEAQPLLAQLRRLREAMDFIGSPLPKSAVDQLAELNEAMEDKHVTASAQKALDPLCLAFVRIDKSGKVETHRGSISPELLQEGWRNFLVKVINTPQTKTSIHVTSPNAGEKPGASPEQAERRWMDVNMFDGRPLTPRLSGLRLEYRIVQIFSSEAGDLEGALEFRTANPSPPDESMIQQWTFDEGLEKWEPAPGIEAKIEDGIVTLPPPKAGGPVFLQRIAPEPNPSGKLELRFWMSSPRDFPATVLWADGPLSDGDIGQAPFRLKKGGPREYRVLMDVKKRLTGMRIAATNDATIGWIRLSRVTADSVRQTALTTTFRAVAATPVSLRVLDAKGRPTTASFLIRDERGRIYPTQSKRLAPDFFFHPQVYRRDKEQVTLPPGKYTFVCSRGPESIPETRQVEVGEEPMEFAYRVKRWVDPAERGWYSGDHHIHAAGCAHYSNPTQGVHAPDMARHCMGEDLKVGCNLTWGPCFDYQKQFFTGKVSDASEYPYLLRYDVEVSGFGSHVSGHLCLLRLREQIFPGGESKDHWPTLGLNTLKWAKAQGAITGPAHSSAGLAPTDQRVDGQDGPPLPGWRGFGGPNRKPVVALPNHFIPRYDGIGANEFIVDITHNVPGPDGKLVPSTDFISSMNTERVAEWNMWYHTLNCGFRVKTSGETDFPCVTGARVGIGRVYVKVTDRLDYDDWCQGLTEGRSYVSDGTAHLMDLTASHKATTLALGENGSELKLAGPGSIRLTCVAAVRQPGKETSPIELIHNGLPVMTQTIPANGESKSVTFDVKIQRSSWVAIRSGASAHTNPVFVIVDNQPIRASVASAEWCLRGVDQCWEKKRATYAEAEQKEANDAYEHARATYRRILDEAKRVSANSQ